MAERLVDVLDRNGLVLHTYPITISDEGGPADDAAYQEKALDAAAFSHLVSPEDLGSLRTQMHLSRSGPLEPYGDSLPAAAETKAVLDQAVRDRAYYLWDRAGRPEGNAEAFWNAALEQHLRERAYALWQIEGHPEGRSDEHWLRAMAFQAS